jgi:SAM-dependent methyltransferase
MNALTRQEHWDQGYLRRQDTIDCGIGWRYHTNVLILRLIESIGLEGKNILEIGAGDSQWLPYLARKHPKGHFAGLDYSKIGCDKLAKRVAHLCEHICIDVYQEDFLVADSPLHGRFDLVFSFGVVEHFAALSQVLSAKRRYMKGGGLMLSLIPNMAGVIGHLTNLFNREIYDMHNPHDWDSFAEGHRQAGLTIISGGYLGFTDFGVLSSCLKSGAGFSWHAYVFLSRLSKAIWWLENRWGDLPATRALSPYIYSLSSIP